MIRILASIASKGDGAVNEDLFGHYADTAWLLDGATGVAAPRLDPLSDAAWLVRRADEYMTKFVSANPEQSIQTLMKRVIGRIKDEYEASIDGLEGPQWPPSAACILARRVGHHVEFFGLGDCAALFKTPGSDIVLVDGGVNPPLDEDSLRQLVECQAAFPDASHEEVLRRLEPVLRQNRSRMNRPDGYWILSTDETAAEHAQTVAHTIGSGPIILMSDGFMRGIDMLGGLSLRAFYELILENGPKAILDKIRAVETEDAICRRFPRFKVHDDATCAVLSFG